MDTGSRKGETRSDHELARLVGAIKGIAEAHLSQSHRALEECNPFFHLQTRHDFHEVFKQADRLLNILHHENDRSKDPSEDGFVCASVRESVNRVLRILHRQYPFDRVTVVKIIPHDLSPLPVSREHLDTMLFELVSQARRAIGRSGGIMKIEAEEQGSNGERGCVPHCFRIRIADTGPSLLFGDLAHLFDPVIEPRSYRFRDGVGLYNVRKLAERYHGTICVESKFREATFLLELPAAN